MEYPRIFLGYESRERPIAWALQPPRLDTFHRDIHEPGICDVASKAIDHRIRSYLITIDLSIEKDADVPGRRSMPWRPNPNQTFVLQMDAF
jgi:hypothetical protein